MSTLASPELNPSIPVEFAPLPFKVGENVGETTILGLLGKQESAAVYFGKAENGDLVAIKAPLNEEGEDGIITEGSVLEQLQGEGVFVDLIGLEEENGHVVLVTHLQEGGDLASIINPLEPRDLVDHERISDVIEEIEVDVEFLEQTGQAGEISPQTYGTVVDEIAQTGVLQVIARDSHTLDREGVVEKVAEVADALGESLDPEGYTMQRIALEVAEKLNTIVIPEIIRSRLPGAEEIKERLPILHTVAVALQKLHLKGKVHLDVKDSNVFMNSHGEARLGDLASVRNIGDEIMPEDYRASNENKPVQIYGGAPLKIGAPRIKDHTYDKFDDIGDEDCVHENQVYDESFDSFGLAVVAFKAVTGVKPFNVVPGMDRMEARDILQRQSQHHDLILEQADKGLVSHELADAILRGISPFTEVRPTDEEWVKVLAA